MSRNALQRWLPATLLVALATAGCATPSATGFGHSSAGGEPDSEPSPSPPAAPKPGARAQRRGPALPVDIVARSALTFHGSRRADHQPLEPAELMSSLARARAICVGESHTNPHHHWAQLQVLGGLLERAATSGREVGVGFEMFERAHQPELDDFLRGDLDERALLEQVAWDESWGYDFSLYRPLIQAGPERGVALLALDAAHDLTHRVAQGGLGSLSDAERALLPELDLKNAAHRAAFDAQMKDHPHQQGNADDLYVAQVIWDETMADAAARWLLARAPARQLLIVAGLAHCADSAIPGRLRRRGVDLVVNVEPLIATSDEPSPTIDPAYDYGLVMGEP